MSEALPVMRVACAQVAPSIGDLAANRERAEAALEEAFLAGAQLVVLPELCSSGYVFESEDEARALAEPVEGPTLAAWAALARSAGGIVVGGFCELAADGRLHNTAAAVDGGGVLAIYRKIHLWDREKLVFSPGESPAPVVETPLCRIGIGVCYDILFPEVPRALALAGADILVFPTNSPRLAEPRSPLPMEALVAMATAHVNRVYVIVADRCGTERGVEWIGGSVVVGPDGWLLAGPPESPSPAVLLADCDVRQARDKRWGERNDLFGDRKPFLYPRLP
jgi:predicted amidohydrolase